MTLQHQKPEDEIEVLPDVKTVLVTGASGFIGHHLAARLERLGKAVVRVSRASGVDVTHDRLPLEGVGHVFHAAGRTGVVDAWADPLAYVNVNAFGTAHVLEQCRIRGCGMTYIGAYIYGVPKRLPIHETDRVEPNNPYSFSKYLGEQVCSFYAKAYGLPVVMLRMFNVYGPGQTDTFVIPSIVQQIVDPRYTEINVMDLAPRRDYVYVSDAVDGILQSTRALPGSIFNLGSGKSSSIKEIIEKASAAAGITKPYSDSGERRLNEIDDTVADITSLTEATGWLPRVSIDKGLAKVVNSMQK